MANENYQNVNTQADEQHEQQMTKNKSTPRDMLEAWNRSINVARATLTEALREIRNEHSDMDIGSVIRRFRISLLENIKRNPIQSFNIVFGLLGLAVFDSLTEEDKEALRNDTFDNN